jgi:hypothetical protein
MAVAVVPAAAADRFIDLARLGHTDAWSGLRGGASIVGWYLLAAVAYYTVGRAVHLPLGGPVADAVELLAVAAGFGLGVRSAVTFCQGRPFGSLFGPDLRLRPGRVAAGAGLWLAGLAAGITVAAAIDALSGGPATASRAISTGAPAWGRAPWRSRSSRGPRSWYFAAGSRRPWASWSGRAYSSRPWSASYSRPRTSRTAGRPSWRLS